MGQNNISNSAHTVTEPDVNYVLNFQRHEFKYFIPKNRIEILIPQILMHAEQDGYNKSGYYNLYSIYYDTEDWQSFHEKLDGIERRKKFRTRSYYKNIKPNDKIMLEVKEKNKDIILKRRVPIPANYIDKLQRGELVPGFEDPVYDEWRYNIIRNQIKPKILISYERMAFKARGPGRADFRLTIDRNIKWSMVNDGRDFNAPLRDTLFSKHFSVLEVKFGEHPPKFVLDIIRRYNLRSEAISKYTESVISNYLSI